MKYLIVTPGYPSNNKIYNNAFVHSRVKQYVERNLDITVFSINKSSDTTYTYDGVEVIEGNYNKLSTLLKKEKFSKILIHFGFKKTIQTVIRNSPQSKLIIWVHGVEALGWYRRLFVFDIKKPHRFLGYIFFNMRQLLFMNQFIKNNKIDKTFVFVSEWMKNILEYDSMTQGKIKKYEIIPNVVDDKLFNYVQKKPEDRLKILSIRPYASKKYANDLSVKAVLELSKKPFFDELTFTFYGDGKLFDSTLAPLKKFNNVIINKKFLTQQEISSIYKENGIILIPTRQDAQGVSMCEAMSSGLVPVTSNNTAIPEYVNNECGYLCNSYKEMAYAIEELINNPDTFQKKSKVAAEFIKEKCSPKIVIEKELNIITRK